MRIIVIFMLFTAGIAAYYFGSNNVPQHKRPHGVLVVAAPIEKEASLGPWKKAGYLITPITTYNGHARVIEKFNPYFSSPSYSDQPTKLKELSPYDLTVGWRELSDSSILEDIYFNHGGDIFDRRILYFSWKYCKHPDFVKTLLSTAPSERKFDHLHIIPADKSVYDTLEKTANGDIIELNGYISDVKTPYKKDVFGDKTYSENSIPGKILWLTELKIEQ